MDAIWWSSTHSDRHSFYNTHVRTCPRYRDKKLLLDWRGFDDCKETIEQWVVDSGLINLKDALHSEDRLSLEGVLSEQQILAINARFMEAERQWASAGLEAIAGLWEALDRDLIDILERTEHQNHQTPYQGARPG